MSLRASLEKEFRIVGRDGKALALAIALPLVTVGLYAQLGATTPRITDGGYTADTRALVLSLSIMFPALLASSAAVVREKMAGTLNRLAKTPLSLATFLASKFLALAFIVIVQSVVLLLAASFLLAGLPDFNLPAFIGALVLLGVSTQALGILLSTLVATDTQAAYLSSIMALAMITLCGFIRPLAQLGSVGGAAAALPYTQGYHALFFYFGQVVAAEYFAQMLLATGALLAVSVGTLRLSMR